MIYFDRRVQKRGAVEAASGDINSFFERVIVEVAAENYRYFLQEVLLWSGAEHAERECRPPLLSKEKELSGLFSIGISRVCPVATAEYSIQRTKTVKKKAALATSGGRADFYAWFESRAIAIELKRSVFNTKSFDKKVSDEETLQFAKTMISRWRVLKDQTGTALGALRERRSEHRRAVGLGIMAIPVFRGLKTKESSSEHAEIYQANYAASLYEDLSMQLNPDLFARYRVPDAMRLQAVGERGGRFCPEVLFLGVVRSRRNKVIT